ncbi:uncharacterized protein LOC131892134 [Tigriopus californicus]|uniref:uncharacterized protein LOC131892134 n=1 Tax=Tigriopus californicus TaxID=6832 RepID=UPI0027DAA159|nr:uncharacterized protein LOC131892134 [Tigriopus californicus]
MWGKIVVALCLGFLQTLSVADTDTNRTFYNGTQREGKILNLFSIVRFPNTFCVGTNSRNGTCYTTDECTQRGGTTAGSCALGYGVCCTFVLGCGSTSSQNCTYFESTGTEAGSCRMKICPCNGNICQLRLDFETFVLNQPDASMATTIKNAANTAITASTQCLVDQFSVTNPGGSAPSTICGTNSAEHMYVDSSDACNELAFNLGSSGSTVTRSWRIKVTQYSCDYNNLAPDGCTQYFFGAMTDIVQSYNFAGGHHLANQNHLFCVRREANKCRICWTTTAEGDFELTGAMTGANGLIKLTAACCDAGDLADCLVLPGAVMATAAEMALIKFNNGVCGGEFGTDTNMDAAATVCSRQTPFQARFLSDGGEIVADVTNPPNGVRLAYILTDC